jgi:adenine-specific DNA-methyltransferase
MGDGFMKYMGSKRSMLHNGLGKLIIEHAHNANRIVDLFCGAGYVSWFAAENTNIPVLAIDLQSFAIILAKSVIGRSVSLNANDLHNSWLCHIDQERKKSPLWDFAAKLEKSNREINYIVRESRNICQQQSDIGPIWNAYGGHYFSPTQALTLDYMMASLPENENEKVTCMAAIISTASKCAASPGHTAQPFQPTKTAGEFIKKSWSIDPINVCKNELSEICPRHAQKIGNAYVADAIEIGPTLKPSDLVFIDPPYSNVQYSRFYHVLETIARTKVETVSGIGRYPPISDRPQSGFSKKGDSLRSLKSLLSGLHQAGCTIIFTFPKGICSNGLSGNSIKNLASEMYRVEEQLVYGQFSTLGGNNSERASRMASHEMILTMTPK